MLSTLLLFSAVAHALVMRTPASAWNAQQFNDFIAFGDSYTDENRLNYFGGSNGSAPPAGTLFRKSPTSLRLQLTDLCSRELSHGWWRPDLGPLRRSVYW